MDRQAMLDKVVERIGTKGRALRPNQHPSAGYSTEPGVCCYVPPESHPGCAIGCLIEDGALRTAISRWERQAANVTTSVGELMTKFPEVKGILGYSNDREDLQFLGDLQQLHDNPNNWDGLTLKPEAISRFAACEGLLTPPLPSV